MPSRFVAAAALALALWGAGASRADPCTEGASYTLLVHGGFLGDAERVKPPQTELMREVVAGGRERLAQGTRALDVVVEVIATLEDSGLLDAGKGSYFNTAGFAENDASLMDGRSGRSGAVAAMQRLKNPIRAARLVMDKTPHVLFVGTTGEQTLAGLGAELIADPKSYFRPFVEPRPEAPHPPPEHGTVGAVALDRCGHLAAGTSTGGTVGKLPGRVGDSPIVGASTFANESYALSATGKGEFFIQRGVTRDIVARVEYLKMPLQAAANLVVRGLVGEQDRAEGAIIAISRSGEIVLSSNGYGVLHGYASHDKPVTVGGEVP
jgi:isoaspartyl peptidase/L-asparaginase-like protein (Ntn-hydrolase superfamily)